MIAARPTVPERREGDSNPRYGYPYGSLANCWFKPLTHRSNNSINMSSEAVYPPTGESSLIFNFHCKEHLPLKSAAVCRHQDSTMQRVQKYKIIEYYTIIMPPFSPAAPRSPHGTYEGTYLPEQHALHHNPAREYRGRAPGWQGYSLHILSSLRRSAASRR